MEPEKLKQIVEAALLAADEPLTVDQLVKLFRPGEVDKETIRADIREALTALTDEAEGRGYELMQVASGYRYQVRQELSLWISRLWEEKPPRYTRALLETLSLVAYKQPVTRGDIEQVRGVSVSQSIMRTLLERGWVRVVGQREVPGRPSMYGTTREFLDYFNLKSLDQLPPLAEIRELIEPVLVEEIEDEAGDEERHSTGAESGGADPALNGADVEDDDGIPPNPLAAALAESVEDDDVDLDSDDFDKEIRAAIEAADEASARFNAPDPDEAAEEAEVETEQSAGDTDADANREAPTERSQVVDVETTGLDQDEQATSRETEAQPTAKVVQLPRSTH